MDIYLHNTLTGKKEIFKPIRENEAGVYSCGPTVYDYAHIGNFRTFIFGDILRRMFEYNGYAVNQVMNITDVDDKTIKKSQQEKVSLGAITRKYEDLFFKDMQLLNILPANKTPRATESIAEMIGLIEKLLQKGVAYKTSDGVYFDITKSAGYGTLARLDLESATKERISNDEYDKANPRDFSLWKFYAEDDGNVFYEAPFGKGRPGWHIECSAMSMKNLGPTIDIHTGGSDLIFPHHTNEIAQSEAVTGKPFVHYWMHGGFITVEGKKMSKSLGNIITMQTLNDRGIDPMSYRYFVLGAHYSTLINFTWEALKGAQNALKKLRSKLNEKDGFETEDKKILETNKRIFNEFINNDLDMPKVLALVWQVVRDNRLSLADKRAQIFDFDEVLGLKLSEINPPASGSAGKEIPEEVMELKKERDLARQQKNWQKSDELRKEIERAGYLLEDKNGETAIKKRN